ncbi:phage tail tape measure protein [Amycolatopsis sp. CA-126428]|uniref:aggregation-promoting factor C-terminal-like domain-containing protein n=1 Tax=Amycolatopsis sp. CA-126428 TaxID=2073158 RepID=UPI000CD1E9A0|nr:phage tail tape measure protein [Amycolatopsis sp. CA-126428]
MVNSGEVVWIDTLPSARGWGAELAKQAAGAGTRAGAQISRELERSAGDAGRRAGTALGTGIEAAKENVKKVAGELETARNREADAAGKVRVAEARLEETRTSGNAKASALAAAEERLATAQRTLTTAQERTASTSDKFEQAQRNAADATDTVTVSVDKAERRSAGFGSSLADTARQAGSFAFGLTAIGNAASIAMDTLENARLGDKLAAQLGAPADMAADLGRVAGTLYAQAYGDSLDQINEAIRGVIQSGLVMEDATNDQLAGITAKVLNLATAFDQDLGGTTQAVGQLMKTGLARDADEALDVLTRGFQQGADRSQDLLDTMTEYSVQFQKFGLDASMATGLLVQGMQAGARNSDLVADAIKEFSIRAVDGSKLTAQGFQAIGLNAADMAAKIARGGPQATQALDLVLDKLRAMPDPVARSQAAVALFGTQAEDLGQALFALDPSKAVAALGDVAGAADRMGATLNDSAGQRLVAFQRTLETGLVSFFGGVLLPALGDAVQWVRENADWLAPMAVTIGAFATGYAAVSGAIKLYELATKGAAAAQWLLNAAMNANPVGLIVGAIAAVVAAFVYFWNTSAGFRDFWIGLWGAIQNAAQWAYVNILKPAFDGIVAALRFVGQIASWLWSNILSPTFSFIGQAAGILAAVVATVLIGPLVVGFRLVAAIASWLWTNALQPTFSAIGSFFSWLWTTLLKPYFDAWVLVFTLIGNGASWLWTNAIQPAFSAIGSFLGWVWSTLLKPYFDGWALALRIVGDAAIWLYDHGIKPVFDAIGSAVSAAYTNVVKPVLGWFGDRLADVRDGFEKLRDVTKSVFDTIVDFLKKPIQLVIDIIWNNGLRKVYNTAASLIPGVDELPELKLARGGVLPGYAPGRDSVRALLSPGEAVLVPELVRAIGPAAILAANSAARAGRPVAAASGGLVARFAAGGIVGAAPASTVATSATAADPAASTQATDALTAASAALADTVTTVLLPALELLELHTGTLLPAADLALTTSLLGVQGTAVAVWLATSAAVASGVAVIVARQAQLQSTMAGSWSALAAVVQASVTAQNSALSGLVAGLGALRAAVSLTAGWVQGRFAEMPGYAGNPVRWILQWPLNGGLVAAWNKLNADFGLNHPIGPVPIGFATGGPVSGPGTATSDSILARLSRGEFVVRAAIAKRIVPFLDALNGGQAEALRAAGYARGGLVADTGSQANAAITRGLSFARAQAGKPYVWGASGPAGYDCSGLLSAVSNVLRGDSPYRRLGVAASQPWSGFAPGLGSAFATGYNSHHTAGTLAGVNLEAQTFNVPVKVGPGASGADSSQFTGHAFLPVVGGSFVSGGAGGLDPAALVSPYFAEALRQAKDAVRLFPGNVAAVDGAGVARTAIEGARDVGVQQLAQLFASTATASGSPEVVAAVRAVAGRYGWGSGPQWDALSWLISHESGWNPAAANPTSSARGLFQQMESIYGPVSAFPAGQAEWGLSYIASRYHDPLGAKSFWQAHHWYDEGGWLQPGFTPVYNGTGKPELVVPHETARDVFGSLRGNDEPVRLVGELSISDDGLRAFVDGQIERSEHDTGTAIARGVRI